MRHRRLCWVATGVLTVFLVALGFLVFRTSYERFWETSTMIYRTIKMFAGVTGTDYSYVQTTFFDDKRTRLRTYFSLLFGAENLSGWGRVLIPHFLSVVFWSVLVVVIAWLMLLFLKWRYSKHNINHNSETLPLFIAKKVWRYTIFPVKEGARCYLSFLCAHPFIWKLWIFVFLLHCNVGTLLLSFLHLLLSFMMRDLQIAGSLFEVFCEDLWLSVVRLPWWVAVPLAIIAFLHSRKRLAEALLRHYEARNCGFLLGLAIAILCCGSMGKKKTTLITDMSLTQSVLMRQKALSILRNTDFLFPQFPWISLEDDLLGLAKEGVLRNLEQIKAWIAEKKTAYEVGGERRYLYGYDVVQYGRFHSNGLYDVDVFEAMTTYAQAFFIYSLPSSLIVSNYAIRVDEMMLDRGNFPLWDFDFFREEEVENQYSHILDFDALRPGKTVVTDSETQGSFEFGIVTITEIGKERGNQLELKEIKKNAEEANQKNDLFNSWLKMIRHAATIDGYPFVKVFADEQRPESWGADARDLVDVLHIDRCSSTRLALPLFFAEDVLIDELCERFTDFYTRFRYLRGDNALGLYLCKKIVTALWRYKARMYNLYGYCVVRLLKENGTMDGKRKVAKYFLANRKIYKKRFSTDCFSEHFNEKAKAAGIGIDDYPTYQSEKATVAELKKQNSYFIESLY